MADKSRIPKWLRHRALVTAEAVLLVGAGQQLLTRYIEHLQLPNWGRVVITMAMTVGVLGSVVLIVSEVEKALIRRRTAV